MDLKKIFQYNEEKRKTVTQGNPFIYSIDKVSRIVLYKIQGEIHNLLYITYNKFKEIYNSFQLTNNFFFKKNNEKFQIEIL